MTTSWPKQIPNLVDGEFCESVSGSSIPKLSPVSEEVLTLVTRSGAIETEKAIDVALFAKNRWGKFSAVERGRILDQVVEKMLEQSLALAELVSIETGKCLRDAKGEVQAAIQLGKYFSSEGQRLYGQTLPSQNVRRNTILIRQPCGVAALIISGNTPIANFAWKLFPALICGNSVVMKASERTPLSAWKMSKIINEIPELKGVVNILHGLGSECGRPLARSHKVNVLSFTGSTQVGRELAILAAENGIKISLELGGKNALVVCEDADLDRTVSSALSSSFSNAGQRCASSSRIYIQNSVYEKFKTDFVRKAECLKVGFGDDFDLGPVISEESFLRLKSATEELQNAGAKILCGGYRVGTKGYFFAPTIIEGVPADHLLGKTELFGPMTFISPFDNVESAIRQVNDSPYGLTAAIHTKDLDTAWSFGLRVEAGTVNVNAGTHGSEPNFPFGGLKFSGNGSREPGLQALDVYSNWKVISMTLQDSAGV